MSHALRPYQQSAVRKCRRCGKSFRRPPSKAGRPYCSRKCFYDARFGDDRRVSKRCAHCKKPVVINAWRANNRGRIFCSFRCRCDANKTCQILKCNSCGITFEKRKSYAARSANHFCSPKCSKAFHVGKNHQRFIGGVGYGREWPTIAETIRIRDGNCTRCGKTSADNKRALDVHHLKPFNDFGYARRLEAHAETNLVSLCRSCHKLVEEQSR